MTQGLSSSFTRYLIVNIYYKYYSLNLIILAGTPATIALSGMSCLTTAPAPIVTLLPILTGPRIVTPVAKKQSSPIITIGLSLFCPLFPMSRGGYYTTVLAYFGLFIYPYKTRMFNIQALIKNIRMNEYLGF